MTLRAHNNIQISNLWLTDDGTQTGIPLISTVAGLDMLKQPVTGQTVIAIDGTPHVQTFGAVKGTQLIIDTNWMEREMLFALLDVVNAAISAATTLSITILDNDYGSGDFYLTCYPTFPVPVSYPGEFINGKVKSVKMQFTVSTQAYTQSLTAGALTLAGQAATFVHS